MCWKQRVKTNKCGEKSELLLICLSKGDIVDVESCCLSEKPFRFSSLYILFRNMLCCAPHSGASAVKCTHQYCGTFITMKAVFDIFFFLLPFLFIKSSFTEQSLQIANCRLCGLKNWLSQDLNSPDKLYYSIKRQIQRDTASTESKLSKDLD